MEPSQEKTKRLLRVYADGVFDMFHLGHMSYLKRVRAQFSEPIHLVVGVCSDETVEMYKRRPVLSYEIRVQTILMSGFADEVVEAPLRADAEFIERNQIDFVTHGSDWTEESVEKYYGDAKRLNKLKIVPFTPGISTTQIIREIVSRDDLYESHKLPQNA
mmetsp:Transcript_13572/g.20372  ORF Transcript_13572/g.20372 Transcript_13572/m.20372 type:complete len:160 (+) Transcript_13572:152-631(+)|eukprot:CAMPEP_0185029540 /NCGR_PEP_ID=MMETSP1103-20130426/15905_1 /TAXON_ID=36769 /ORGANISM="Paraphysomonas bandaiensis, Strain Caron Lab Isolate" /LENGTH=159 /DNA_ID=CAMNT_0027564333 /DNA_START=56 /DNA_END=535 /DNA_ORIENTATION=-